MLDSCLLLKCVCHSVLSNSLRPHGLYSPPGSSVHGIFQARILEWVAIFFSRGSSQPSDRTHVSCLAGGFFTTVPPTSVQSVQSLSCVRLLVLPWTAARQASLSFTVSRSLLKLMSNESVMPSKISFSVAPFSSCLQSFLASGSFPMS